MQRSCRLHDLSGHKTHTTYYLLEKYEIYNKILKIPQNQGEQHFKYVKFSLNSLCGLF